MEVYSQRDTTSTSLPTSISYRFAGFAVRPGWAYLPYFCMFSLLLGPFIFSITSGLRVSNSHSPENSAISCRPSNRSAWSSGAECLARRLRSALGFKQELVKVGEEILVGRVSSSLFFLQMNNLSMYLFYCFLFLNSSISTIFNSFILLP